MASRTSTPEADEDAETFDPSRPSVEPDKTNTTGPANSAMAEREAKNQRLRELIDKHDRVRTIVNHMEKHYKTQPPPPWLDLRAVASQLESSTRTGYKHAAWGSFRDSLNQIHLWMDGHSSWKEALHEAKIPHIGTQSEIMAIVFIHGKDAAMPKTMLNSLLSIQLDFLLDWEPRANDKLPVFWQDSEFDSPDWRRINMKEKSQAPRLSFSDDLTDLVLSTVCNIARPRLEEEQSPSEECEQSQPGDEKTPESSNDAAGTEKPIKAEPGTKHDSEDVWDDQVQAMSSIAKTISETVSANKSKPLKRHRTKDATEEDRTKRHKTAHSQKPMASIEESDDDRSSASPTRRASTIDDRQYKALKSSYWKLKKQDEQRVALCDKLEESNSKLRQEVDQLVDQHKDLQNGNTAAAEKCSKFGDQIKGLEDDSRKWAVKYAMLVDDVKTLEEQRTAQGSALGDLRTQLATVMARFDALGQGGTAIESGAGGSQTAPLIVDGRTSDTVHHGQQDSTQMGGVEGAIDTMSLEPPSNGDDAATHVLPPAQAQTGWEFKDETSAHHTHTEMDEIPQFLLPQVQPHQSRHDDIPQFLPPQTRSHRPRHSLSHFPRVLEMPTFDFRHDIFNNDPISGYTYPSRLTTYSNRLATAHPQPRTNQTTTTVPTPAPKPTRVFLEPLPTVRPPPAPTPTEQPSQIQSPTPTPTQPQPRGQIPAQDQPQTHLETQDQNQAEPIYPAIQTHLGWLPPAYSHALISFVARLDRRIWRERTQDIVAHCEENGLRYGRLRELVIGFRRVLRDLEDLEAEEGMEGHRIGEAVEMNMRTRGVEGDGEGGIEPR